MIQNITLLTGNPDKIREAESILGFTPKNKDIDLPEIQSNNPRTVIEDKLKKAYQKVNEPVFVWDVSLHFNALNGLPGPFIKWFEKSMGNKGMCEIMTSYDDKTAIARTVIEYFDGEDMYFFEGKTKGEISDNPVGGNGFGWDQIFKPEKEDRTFAQMTQKEKNKYSMHRKALIKFKNFLTN